MATLRNREHGRQGTVESAPTCRDRETPTREDICKCSQRLKLYSPVHNGRRAMWTLSTMQALIFIAVVAMVVALLALA